MNFPKKNFSNILKVSLFATGCAGIVAEFVLSTLATYLTGNAVFQWTLVMSFMLFAMGVGSRLSRIFYSNLIDIFILVEFLLSILCASSAALAYGLASFITNINLFIYFLGFVIGCLIGMEIPLVTRLNEEYEELRINISGVMEKDYYGSLLGGLLFAFVALPCFGLTYTPIILGSINFIVAAIILWKFICLVQNRKLAIASFFICLSFLIILTAFSSPIIRFGEQSRYKDKIIFAKQTKYQKIVMTRWRKNHWLYLNSQVQFSSYDEERYHEPLVHPVMNLSINHSNVLILGGGDGLALREILKYPTVKNITLVDLDPAITQLAQKHPVLLKINKSSMRNPRVQIINTDANDFLKKNSDLFGVIIVDLPDPDTIDMMHVYSIGFYKLIEKHLIKGGAFVTQASSPFFTRKSFLCIMKTIQYSGFSVLPYHNNVPTMGEWGWILGIRKQEISPEKLKQVALMVDFSNIQTRFINKDAMLSMTHFGKGTFEDIKKIQINKRLDPVLHYYYRSGSWGLY